MTSNQLCSNPSSDPSRGSIDNLENITQSSNGSGSSAPGTPEDNINVVVRVRPLNVKESRNADDMVVQFPGNGQILCDGIPAAPGGGGQKSKLFSYNVVFEPGATQDDVVEYSGVKRLIEMAIEGFSCTAFCYGQTGSGKTHTLTGPPELVSDERRGVFYGKPDPQHEYHGLVFRSFLYLFKLLQERKDTNFVLKASFLEIYNEKYLILPFFWQYPVENLVVTDKRFSSCIQRSIWNKTFWNFEKEFVADIEAASRLQMERIIIIKIVQQQQLHPVHFDGERWSPSATSPIPVKRRGWLF
ncbi:kinesin heavy chain [Culex quinquefasciatus]|uniref:Kinesin heavy chain n=1 Tax=Culex quinquefasciatus TaxID=7176 RepID=B0W2P6_CULQU|nr:kinesin heavy chain [Culex quinquefasciatus]|eukprot:XP_001842980.1 kinesin heavy chain [Culex quinquefasciatus]